MDNNEIQSPLKYFLSPKLLQIFGVAQIFKFYLKEKA